MNDPLAHGAPPALIQHLNGLGLEAAKQKHPLLLHGQLHYLTPAGSFLAPISEAHRARLGRRLKRLDKAIAVIEEELPALAIETPGWRDMLDTPEIRDAGSSLPKFVAEARQIRKQLEDARQLYEEINGPFPAAGDKGTPPNEHAQETARALSVVYFLCTGEVPATTAPTDHGTTAHPYFELVDAAFHFLDIKEGTDRAVQHGCDFFKWLHAPGKDGKSAIEHLIEMEAAQLALPPPPRTVKT